MPSTPCAYSYTASLTINIPYLSGMFVTVMTYINTSLSPIAHSLHYGSLRVVTSCGFGQMCNNMYSLLYYHME